MRAGERATSSSIPAAFLRGHIPGATSFDVGERLFDPDGVFVGGLELAMAMSEIGVGDEHTVVIVDTAAPAAALVLAWALRHHGHTETLILEGGFRRWLAENHPVTQAVVRHPFGSFTARTSS